MNIEQSTPKSAGPDLKREAIAAARPFSNLQWYLHHSRNTVYLAAESNLEFTENDLHNIADLFMHFAPQLQCNVAPGENEHVAIGTQTESICKFELTDDLYQSLAETLDRHERIYSDPELPNFRAYGFRLRKPEKDKARSIYVCCSSHALMEGSESARIVRARQSVHQAGQAEVDLGFFQQTSITAAGFLLAPFHLIASAFNRPKENVGYWAVIDIERKGIKKLARQYDVRQRSVLFSLPLFGLYMSDRVSNPTGKKKQLISYSTLPDTKTTLEDTALNLRMQVGSIPTAKDFETHVRNNSKVLDKEDTTEVYSQAFYNSVLGVHRLLHKIFPFFYGKRFFTYIPYDFVLSLLPPHIAAGPFRRLFDSSIFCGSYTPGVNNCVFVPYRNGFSMNFYLAKQEYDNLDALINLLNDLGVKARRVV